jgi:hypothetical protein
MDLRCLLLLLPRGRRLCVAAWGHCVCVSLPRAVRGGRISTAAPVRGRPLSGGRSRENVPEIRAMQKVSTCLARRLRAVGTLPDLCVASFLRLVCYIPCPQVRQWQKNSIRQITTSASHRLLSVEFTARLNGLLDTRISCPIFLWIVFVSGGTLRKIGLLTRSNISRSQHEVCIALECGLACVLLCRLVRPGLFSSEIPSVSAELS